MDVAIVLDMSGSNDQVFDAMLDLTRRLTLGLPVSSGHTRLAVVRYSDSANVSFYLDTYFTGEQVSTASPNILLCSTFLLRIQLQPCLNS